jgi:hypothetical protein
MCNHDEAGSQAPFSLVWQHYSHGVLRILLEVETAGSCALGARRFIPHLGGNAHYLCGIYPAGAHATEHRAAATILEYDQAGRGTAD